MKLIKTTVFVAGVIGVLGTLGACSTYDDGYTSVSVSSRPYYYRDGHRYYRDADGDGIPNRFDDHPYNPYRP